MSDTLQRILEDVKSLEPLPAVVARVMQIASEEDVVPRDLVAVIQTDVGVTAKVLKLCNSAYYGFQREIASLQEAGNLLGVQALVNLVLTSCAERYFRDYHGCSPTRLHELWERSVINALASCLLAKLHGRVDRNRAYTAGLLENVGLIVMERYLTEEARRIDAVIQGGATRDEAERAVLGIDHAEIGAQIAERWMFPEVLVDAIRNHHHPETSENDRLLTSICHLGELVTSAFVLGEGLESVAYGLNDSALGIAGLDRTAFETMEEILVRELEKAREFVAA